MLIRTMIVLFALSASVMAGDLAKIWPKGTTEKLTYNINAYTPKKVTNSLTVTVSRLDTAGVVFTSEQLIYVIDQDIKMGSIERFEGDDLIMTKSENYYKFNPEMAQARGVDSIFIRAYKDGDSLKIRSNYTGAVPGTMPYYDGLTSTTGSLLTSRNKNFTPGYRNEFAFINLLLMTGKPYEAYPAADSVIGVVTLTVPAGTFECYKVRNDAINAYGYTYFMKDGLHTPVKTELLDINTGETISELVLMKKE